MHVDTGKRGQRISRRAIKTKSYGSNERDQPAKEASVSTGNGATSAFNIVRT